MAERRTSNDIYLDLKREISNGGYSPSFALTEVELSKKYGVCRNTVKKSLMMLEADGLVTLERNKGAKVKVYSIDEVLEFLEVREELESFIAKNAARNIKDDQIVQLSQLLEEMKEMKEKHALLEYSNRNRAFHKIIYEACTNKTAVELTLQLKEHMKKYNSKTILVPGRDESSLIEHTKILESIKNHNENDAELYMRIHIRNVADTFRKNFNLLF